LISDILGAVLGPVFPPSPGKIEGVETVLLLHAIREGHIKVLETDGLHTEEGLGSLIEWPDGRWRPGRKVSERGERGFQ